MEAGIDYMPTLAVGAHSSRSGEACVMEYVSVLAGEEFSDSPTCTHPMIATVARGLNDTLYDQQRPLLIPLIPRLLVANTKGMAPDVQRAVDAGLQDYAKNFKVRGIGSVVQKMLNGFCNCALHKAHANTYEAVVVTALQMTKDAEEQIRFLAGLLDEFDHLTGRTEKVEPISAQRMTQAVAKVENKPDPYAPKVDSKVKYAIKAVTGWFPVDAVKPVVHYNSGVNYEAIFADGAHDEHELFEAYSAAFK